MAALALALALPAEASENPAGQPPFGAEPLAELERVPELERPPPGFELSAAQAIEVADRAREVIDERAEDSPAMEPRAFTRGSERWQISYFAGPEEVAQAVVDDRTGELVEAWRDQQVEVKLARGYEGAVAGNVSKAWIWVPLCMLFVLPFFDPKRPFRLLHLDLLVLLSFSISSFFFNKGEIALSVPLVYPALAYLFVRMLIAGFVPRRRAGALIPLVPVRGLVYGIAALALFRVGLNLIDSQVIDIGFAGVVGADRIGSGEGIYDGQFSPLIDRGDSYGPFNYLLYVPFEAIFPYGGGLEPLPAAHALAIFFDLLVVGLLYLVGRRLRGGEQGTALGVALAFAWLAYPYTLYALNVNGNDAIVVAALLGALLALGSAPARAAVLALGAAAKFGPLALVPLFAAGRGERR
ncbi:MAG TPA: glycosyltransferase 87 family protein, partial [Candidatus Limnocylindrales bacterium]|nr:glycosyltransferase 87 family protein [Candidatus Limnocylindrales bacterium]